MNTIKDNAKLLALKNEIASAIEAGKLDAKMDILRLMAADIDLNEKDLEDVINDVKSANQEKENLTKLVASKKKWIRYSSIALVAVEWILAFAIAGKLSFWEVMLLILINIISVLIDVFVISIIIKRKSAK